MQKNQVIHAVQTNEFRKVDEETVDRIATGPPYLLNDVGKTGRTLTINDDVL